MFPRREKVWAKCVYNVFAVRKMQGGRGHCAVYYTSPQSFKITFINLLP